MVYRKEPSDGQNTADFRSQNTVAGTRVRIAEREEEIVVTRNGKPAAVLVNYDEYERLKDSLEVLSDPDLMKQIRRDRGLCKGKARHVFRGRLR